MNEEMKKIFAGLDSRVDPVLLLRAVEQNSATIVITDPEGTIIYANAKFVEMTGYTIDEALGQNPRILKGEDGLTDYKEMWQMLSSGQQWRGDFHNKRKNGEFFWERAAISPILDGNGNITHFLGVQEDITERKLAEKALQKSEASLKAIFDNTSQAFVLVDRNCAVQAFNKTAGEGIELVLGREIKEGDSACDFVPEKELDQFKKDFEKVLSGGSVSRENNIRLGPIEKWVEVNYNPVFVDNGQVIGVCFSAIDIDERKEIASDMGHSVLVQEFYYNKKFKDS